MKSPRTLSCNGHNNAHEGISDTKSGNGADNVRIEGTQEQGRKVNLARSRFSIDYK